MVEPKGEPVTELLIGHYYQTKNQGVAVYVCGLVDTEMFGPILVGEYVTWQHPPWISTCSPQYAFDGVGDEIIDWYVCSKEEFLILCKMDKPDDPQELRSKLAVEDIERSFASKKSPKKAIKILVFRRLGHPNDEVYRQIEQAYRDAFAKEGKEVLVLWADELGDEVSLMMKVALFRGEDIKDVTGMWAAYKAQNAN